ncbi:MAG: hypothetical protein LBP87_13660 [Planctomycetaceae bacterium]|nr:hypothetical protein [Planctomycetaceae bacterium]
MPHRGISNVAGGFNRRNRRDAMPCVSTTVDRERKQVQLSASTPTQRFRRNVAYLLNL